MNQVLGYEIEVVYLPEEAKITIGEARFDHNAKTLSIELAFNVNNFSINIAALECCIEAKTDTIRGERILESISQDASMITTCQFFIPNTLQVENLGSELPADWEYNRPNITPMCNNPTLTSVGGERCVPCSDVQLSGGHRPCHLYTRNKWQDLKLVFNNDEVVARLQRMYRGMRIPVYRITQQDDNVEYAEYHTAKIALDDIAQSVGGNISEVQTERLGFFAKVLTNATIH